MPEAASPFLALLLGTLLLLMPDVAFFGITFSVVAVVDARVIDFEADAGGIPGDDSNATAWHNGRLLNETLNSLQSGDELVFQNKTYTAMGGIVVHNLQNVVIRIEGTISYKDSIKDWPRQEGGRVLECLYIENATNLTVTSTGKGVFQGNGAAWWGIPGIGYLEREENRPRLFHITDSKQVLIENVDFLQSPYWTFLADNMDGLEVRFCDIEARRTDLPEHDIVDLSAFNTDGYDVTGNNVWIHDCSVWNQDDCIAVKDNSQNMLFERINASGMGLTIGSISSHVKNITFRDCYMKNTAKGIYMKFRGDGLIEDVLYENIVIDEPEQYAVWIGPAQQSDSRDLCAAHPCSICWPTLPFAECHAPKNATYRNITLRNITINNPKLSPGVILANASAPMENIVFDNVVVTNPSTKPFKGYYECENVANGVATGTTSPVPPCFKDLTNTV